MFLFVAIRSLFLLAPFLLAKRAEARELTVLAAASLTESLPKVAAAWQAGGNEAVDLRFDASSRLAKQVEAGAPGDVFVSADVEWMAYLDREGLLTPGTRVDLLGNTLVAVVPAGATFVPEGPTGLADVAVRHLALAGENVPAGRYARAALEAARTWDVVKARVVHGDSVRTALGWVARGEAEAGVVYATDAALEPRVTLAFSFPTGSYPAIVYPAAVLRSSPHPDVASRFVAFCGSAQAQAIFHAAGFLPAPARAP